MPLEINRLNIRAAMTKGVNNIVKNLSFSVVEGEPLAIVGESGSGKTMTALSVFGLLPENCRAEGSIVLNGKELLGLGERKLNGLRGGGMVYIPQNGADFLNPSLKVKTQMFESLRKKGVKDRAVLYAAARRALENVGVEETEAVLNKYPFQLSGGQAQRVVLAMSLGNAKLVIADEPTKGIDSETAEKFLLKLDEIFTDACVIIITHNISVAERCKKTLVMQNGEKAEYGSTEKVLNSPQSEYTKSLLASLPENWGRNFGRKGGPSEISPRFKSDEYDESTR